MACTLLLSATFLFIFIPTETTRTIGTLGLPLSAIAVIFYSVLKRDLSLTQKIITITITSLVFISQASMFLSLPFASLIGALMIIPIMAYATMFVIGISKFKNQFGFLTIFTSIAFARFAFFIQQGI